MTLRVLLIGLLTTATVRAGTLDLFPDGDLRAALLGLTAGDELVIHAGTYTTQSSGGSFFLQVNWVGTEAEPIVIRAADGAQPVIRGDFSQNVINVEGSYFTLRGLEITGGSHGLRLDSVDHAIFEDLVIHDVGDVGFSCNRSGNVCDRLNVRRNEIYNTGIDGGVGEGMYIGCNNATCEVSNSVFTENYIHDLGGSQGDGIEIKTGSWGNRVSDNVIVGANFPGITMYGFTEAPGRTRNVVERNFVWNTVDNGIQVVGQVVVSSNIIVASGASGISAKPSQGFSPRDLEIVHNTVFEAGDACMRGNNWGLVDLGTAIVANNAFYCEQTTALQFPDGAGTAIIAGNVGLGAGLISGVEAGNSANEDFGAPASRDFWPRAGSALIGAGASQYALPDFNAAQRNPPDVTAGAYERTGSSNPGWQLQSGFKALLLDIFSDGFESL